MPRFDTQQTLDKINECLEEVSELRTKSYKEGNDRKTELDHKINTIVKLGFDDWEYKLNKYDQAVHSHFAVAGLPRSEEDEHDSYISDLGAMEIQLKAYKDELELVKSYESDSLKLDKAEREVVEAKKEADRREAVAESKFYGAAIEIIDRLRDELKRHGEISKDIV